MHAGATVTVTRPAKFTAGKKDINVSGLKNHRRGISTGNLANGRNCFSRTVEEKSVQKAVIHQSMLRRWWEGTRGKGRGFNCNYVYRSGDVLTNFKDILKTLLTINKCPVMGHFFHTPSPDLRLNIDRCITIKTLH